MQHAVMDNRLKFINIFAKYFLFLLLFADMLSQTVSSGFDSASSCSPNNKMSRRGRAQTISSIPCDFSKQAYCNLPGSLYPWHAVRRFVHENQGLMKRMYGDVRHISVIRKEFENNDITSDDVDATAERYGRQSKYMHSEYQNIRNNEVLMEPHFRPVSTTTTSTTSTPSKSTQPPPTVTTHKPRPYIEDLDDVDLESDDEEDEDDSLETNSVYEQSSDKNIIESADNIKIVKSPDLGVANGNHTETATISTTLRIVQQIIKSDTIEATEKASEAAESLNQEPNNIDHSVDGNKNSLRTTLLISNVKSTDKTNEHAPSTEASVRTTETYFDKKKTEKPAVMEGQLFQDTVQKEQPVVTNMRGVNACPVKEEVVAPFWANNTRGEVLALLNLYPFEQYVHWEKCTNEHKQMYCRDGCRCEQQYRLHRLLAYDPHNECRGIFSDWFRFPSCCICKCYDIPLEFRATSRSPRAEHMEARHPIDVAESEVKKAIYEHATEDWYRPRDEFDLD